MLTCICMYSCMYNCVIYAGGVQSEREDKVSLELNEEILQSMEVGMAFRDYVCIYMYIQNFSLIFYFRIVCEHISLNCVCV